MINVQFHEKPQRRRTRRISHHLIEGYEKVLPVEMEEAYGI
jgi:hypothetical protein